MVSPIQVDKDLMELLLHKKKVMGLRTSEHPLYSHLHSYVQTASEGPVQRKLFARLLHCSEGDVDKRLSVKDTGERVKAFARQLYEGGFTVEAGALMVTALGFHRELLTVTDSLAYVNSLFAS